MLRELNRFTVEDADGRPHEVVEVVEYRVYRDGREESVTKPTLLTAAGLEVLQTGSPGEYHIPRIGATAWRR